MIRALAATIALLAFAAPAAAQVVSARPDAVTITLYRDRPVSPRELAQASQGGYGVRGGLVFVTETRTLTLPAGASTVEFRGVADGIVAQSATLEGVAGRLLEQNLDYDLLSPGSLAGSAVGRAARLVRTNAQTGAETAVDVTVRAAPQGLIVQSAEGIEALGCSGGPERLVFYGLPPSLRAEPTLSAAVRTERAGPRRITLSYLAVGLSWSADYVVRIAPDGRTLDLTGWLTLANFGRTTFEGAPTQVVAGQLMRDPSTQPVAVIPQPLRPSCWPINAGFNRQIDKVVVTGRRIGGGGPPPPSPPPPPPPPPPVLMMPASAPVAVVSDLGDYKLYTLPEPTTMAAQSTKQVRFLEQRGVPFERLYRADVRERAPGATAVALRLQNTTAGGLGVALPQGTTSTYARDAEGTQRLVGQARLPRDGPVGLPVEIGLGTATDVQAWWRTVDGVPDENGGPETVEVELSNARPDAVTVEVRDVAQARVITAETAPSFERDARFVWRVEVPANGRATLRYTIARQS